MDVILMRTRRSIAVAAACLCLAGCFKGGQKAPLVENNGSSKLEKVYARKVKQRLSVVFEELLSLKKEIKKVNKEWGEYHELKQEYINTKERYCGGTGSLDPDILYEELLEWHTQIQKDSLALSLKATRLLVAVRNEMKAIEEAEEEVGHPIIDKNEKKIARNMQRLSVELRGEIPNVEGDIVAEPPCVPEGAIVADKGGEKADPGQDELGESPASNKQKIGGRDFRTTLEPEIGVPKKEEEDIYSDDEVDEMLKNRR